MNDYVSDQEQVELIRKWWAENGKFIIGGIVLGIGGLVGWNRYNAAQESTSREASVLFDELQQALADDDGAALDAARKQLVDEYGSTPYVAHAWLATARHHMDNGRHEDAAAALRTVVEGSFDSELTTIARMRLARVLLYLERADEAAELLTGYDAGQFQPRVDEILGDIALAQDEPLVARTAWESALANPGTPPLVNTSLIQMKIAALELEEPDGVIDPVDPAPLEP